jgi:hypothetical protein
MSGPSSQTGRTKVEMNESVLLNITVWSVAQAGLDISNTMVCLGADHNASRSRVYTCQHLDHIWVDWKQPPRSMKRANSNAENVRPSITAATEEQQRRHQFPCGHSTASKLAMSGRTYAAGAAAPLPQSRGHETQQTGHH